MKIPWTTITKDESTWPKEHVRFLVECEDNEGPFEAIRSKTVVKWSLHGYEADWPNYFLGYKWRPLPKVSYKKDKNIQYFVLQPKPFHHVLNFDTFEEAREYVDNNPKSGKTYIFLGRMLEYTIAV